ncbi:unnamed protein product [Ambrosiozyma monospora]|uniref:Unnamed protein product n=1 Tax=Ambrosiozyma monospora TaxID=43982 RepID=A0ACB5T8W7_AMBMO|nr:unnamed protein product [Ambrosiozyma monospora]
MNSIASIVPEVLHRMSVADKVTKSTGIGHLDVTHQNNLSSSKSVSPSSEDIGKGPENKNPESKNSESVFESINTMFSPTNTSTSRSSESGKQINNTISPKTSPLPHKDSLSSGIGSRLLTAVRSNRGSVSAISPSTSKPSFSPNSSITPLNRRSSSHKFEIELTFNPSHHSQGSSSPKPPTSIKIKPRLQVLTIQSDKPIPIAIDGEFLMESSALLTAQSKIDSLKERLVNKYLTTWSSISHECEGQINVPRNVYQDLLALVRMQLVLPCGSSGGIDMFETVECKDLEWSKSPDSGVYHAELTFKLFLDEKKLKQTTGDANTAAGLVHLVPSFQTCLLGRFYAVRFEFEYGYKEIKFGVKDSKKAFASLPIDVV